MSVRVCPRCFAAERSGRSHCSNCGAAYPIAARKVAHVNGELEEVTEPSDGRREQGAARSLAALVELGKLRGYRNPGAWAQHVMAGRSAKGRA